MLFGIGITTDLNGKQMYNLPRIEKDSYSLTILLSEDPEDTIYQLVSMPRKNASFVGDYCQTSSNFLLAQPMDPLLLYVYLKNKLNLIQQTSFLEYDMLFESGTDDFKDVLKILSTNLKLKERMKLICDVIQVSDEERYRFNEGKLMDLLVQKLKKVINHVSKDEQTYHQKNSFDINSTVKANHWYLTLFSAYLTQSQYTQLKELSGLDFQLKKVVEKYAQYPAQIDLGGPQVAKSKEKKKQPTKAELQLQKDAAQCKPNMFAIKK